MQGLGRDLPWFEKYIYPGAPSTPVLPFGNNTGFYAFTTAAMNVPGHPPFGENGNFSRLGLYDASFTLEESDRPRYLRIASPQLWSLAAVRMTQTNTVDRIRTLPLGPAYPQIVVVPPGHSVVIHFWAFAGTDQFVQQDGYFAPFTRTVYVGTMGFLVESVTRDEFLESKFRFRTVYDPEQPFAAYQTTYAGLAGSGFYSPSRENALPGPNGKSKLHTLPESSTGWSVYVNAASTYDLYYPGTAVAYRSGTLAANQNTNIPGHPWLVLQVTGAVGATGCVIFPSRI